jgi:hypothetical protein
MQIHTTYNLRLFQRYNDYHTEVRMGNMGQDCLWELERNRKYPIFRPKKNTTRIGPAVVLTIRDPLEDPAQVFLPKRYSAVMTTMILRK